MRRLLLVAALVALLAGGSVVVARGAENQTRVVDLTAYRGLGTWVDVYDYVPGFQGDGGPPPVTAASVDDMAAVGVRTIFLQAAQDDDRLSGDTVAPSLLGSFLRRAHARGVKVVAWYLPKFDDLDADLRRIEALHRFRSRGQRFDGLALDIEWTRGVPDPAARNEALLALSRRAREIVGERQVLGAIVLEPLLLEQVNPRYWPDFPWKQLAPMYDAWLPMAYWTNRTTDSGLREGFRYTDENISLLRERLDQPDAPVHVIGGIANDAVTADYEGFVRAAKKRRVMGLSVYDFNTTTSGVWARLRDP